MPSKILSTLVNPVSGPEWTDGSTVVSRDHAQVAQKYNALRVAAVIHANALAECALTLPMLPPALNQAKP